MKNIWNKLIKGVLTIGVAFSLYTCLMVQEKNKPFDLSAENATKKELAQPRPEFSFNSDSTIFSGFMYDSDQPNYKGDSIVFKFDRNSHLISRERYFGSDPNQIYFISTIFRNREGKIDLLISRIGEPTFKPISNLFKDAEKQINKEQEIFEGKTNILLKNIKTYRFTYDTITKNYYLK